MTTLIIVSSIIISLILDSFIEWATHKFPMHMKVPRMEFFFWHHITIHHTSTSGKKYYQKYTPEKSKEILFPLWVPPLLIATATTPFTIASYLLGEWTPFYSSLGIAFCYYMAFEGFHQVMHLKDHPAANLIRQTIWFKWLDQHHQIHHMKANTNFNLVLPIADWFLGTLVTKMPDRDTN